MKKVLVTTKLLKLNEDRMSKLWNVKLNLNGEVYSQNKLIELSKDCDGILSSVVDKINKSTIMAKKNIITIVQARLTSTRFKNKVFQKIGKFTIIELIFKRLKKSKKIDKIIFAIPRPSSTIAS